MSPDPCLQGKVVTPTENHTGTFMISCKAASKALKAEISSPHLTTHFVFCFYSRLCWHNLNAVHRPPEIESALTSFSALTLLVWQQEGHSTCKKAECWDVGVVICLGGVQICIWPSRMPLPSLSLAPVNADWFYLPGFTFLVQAHLGSPRQNPEEP